MFRQKCWVWKQDFFKQESQKHYGNLVELIECVLIVEVCTCCSTRISRWEIISIVMSVMMLIVSRVVLIVIASSIVVSCVIAIVVIGTDVSILNVMDTMPVVG